MSKFTHIIKRSGAKVPFKPERISNAIYRAAVAVGGRDKSKASELGRKVIEYLESKCPENHSPAIEEIQDAVEKILIENGHAKVAKAYILYRDERNRKRREEVKYYSQPNTNIPWAKIWRILDWSVDHKLQTVEDLNLRIANGEFPHIVHESEALYEDDVSRAVEMIRERIDELRIVFISGPSSSGKTTTTIKLENKLTTLGYKFKVLNVDNYFFDLEIHPKDEFGDYDFETPQALDLEMINNHLSSLAAGKEVLLPFYDFKEGKRYPDRTPMILKKDELLLIDSLHGLYPDLSSAISNDKKFRLYLEPLLQMKDNDGNYVKWTDIRMIRRMLRDSVHRAYNPKQTLEHWHYVRSSEMRHIIPYSYNTDFIISSAMPYELPLYAHRLLDQFEEWQEKYKDDPLREDAFDRSFRVYKLLKSIAPVADDSPVPKDSVLREFIGGSVYSY